MKNLDDFKLELDKINSLLDMENFVKDFKVAASGANPDAVSVFYTRSRRSLYAA